MSNEYIIQKETLTNIANAVRARGSNLGQMNAQIAPVSPVQVPSLIEGMPDLQFFIAVTEEAVDDHVTSAVQSYKQRFHNGPYLVLSNTISTFYDKTECELSYLSLDDTSTAIIEGSQVKFSPSNTVGDNAPDVDKGKRNGYVKVPFDERLSFYAYDNDLSRCAVIGCNDIPAVGVVGTVIKLVSWSNGQATENLKFQFAWENIEQYKYLYLINCEVCNYNGGPNCPYNINLKYIISDTKPEEEAGLLWIKTGKSDIVENIPIIYNSPNMLHIDDTSLVTSQNNIYIKPVDIQICFGEQYDSDGDNKNDYTWCRPWSAYIVNGDKITPIIEHNGIRTLDVEKKEKDIIPELIAGSPVTTAGVIKESGISIDSDKIFSVGNFAFYSNQNIASINAPRCDYIGSSAFTSCTNLQHALFKGCGQIYTTAFTGCINLKTAWFPNCSSVTGGSACFTGATSIETVAYGFSGTLPATHPFKKAAANIKSFYLPYVTSMASACLAGHTKLQEFIAPNLTAASTNAFSQCTSLSRVILGIPSILTNANHRLTTTRACLQSAYFPNCTALSNYTTSTSGAFYNYSKLQYASFPMCSTIGGYAFNNCVNLTSLVLNGSQFCNLTNSNAFNSTPIGGYSTTAGTYGTIYVPASMVSLYKTEATWSNFADRITSIKNMPDGVLDADKWWENFEVEI